MSVLIKGMKMPEEGCKDCRLVKRGQFYDICQFLNRIVNGNVERGGKPADCPLVELPDHGDLIDRDALMARYAEEVRPSNNSDFIGPPRWNDAVQLTELAPVVIPAERSEASLCDNCDQRNDKGCCVCKYIKERSEDGETKQISAEFAKLMREGEIQVRWRNEE